jgi:hypothetical protein
VVLLRQPGVCDDELAAVQYVVRDQAVAEGLDLGAELVAPRRQLLQRLG